MNLLNTETQLKLVSFNESLSEEWDRFVLQAKTSTFLHTRSFYKHNEQNALDDHSLLFYKGKRLIAVFPAILYNNNGILTWHSHMRSTYGGILFSNDLAVADLESVIRSLIDYGRDNQINDMIIRPTFSIYHRTLSAELDYLLWKNGFTIKTRELELAIDLSQNIDDNIDSSTKRSIKKAAKEGVSVEETEAFEDYWKVLEKNLQQRYDRKPVHSLEQILLLRSLVGENKVRLFCAKHSGNIIGGVLAFVANEQVLHAQYIASDIAFQELRPLNAVIDFITRKAQSERFKYFNLGMASEPGGTELNYGLVRFKEGFGARGVLRETLSLSLKS